MDNSGSIVEFFYNIIPGSLFLFLLNYCYNINVIVILGFKPDNAALIIFVYIVLGLFLGFVFQGMTKFVRKYFGWNSRIAKRVKDSNPDKFKDVYNKIYNKKYKDSNLISSKETLEIFYFLDCSLRGSYPAFLPTHFSSRFAFWANIFFALIILIILDLFVHPCHDFTSILVIVAAISFYWADQYFEGFYDSIFKSFYMLKVKNN